MTIVAGLEHALRSERRARLVMSIKPYVVIALRERLARNVVHRLL